MNRHLFLSISLAAAGFILPAGAVEFYPIAGVSSDTAGSDFFPADRLIEGAGVGFDAAEPHDRVSTLTWVTNAPNGGAGDYFDPLPAPAARLVFDLGEDVVLSEISFWGYADTNANGANEFELRFASAADGDTGFGSSITYNPSFAPTQPVTPRQSFAFSQTVVARYVEFTPTDNFFAISPPGGDRVGLGEIAFQVGMSVDPSISVPGEITLDLDPENPTEFDVPVTNSGQDDLVISATGLSGTDAAAFTVVTVNSPIGTLATENIALQFDPAGINGPVSATLQITSNDPDMTTVEVLLTGSLPVAAPDISVPASVTINAGGTLLVPVSNAGLAQLDLSAAMLSGADASAFEVITLPPTIPGLGMADIVVAFDPAGVPPGPISATLSITSNDPDTPEADVTLNVDLSDAFYPIASVTSTTAASDFFPAERLIEGAGIGFDASAPHDRTSTLTWVTNAPNGGAGDYFSPLPATPPALVFDLGEDVGLKEISYWGYADTNANGANLFALRFATASDGPEGFGTSISYNPMFAPFQDMTPRQSFEFDQGVFARYVEWVPLDNYFGINPPGGDRIGAGEIAFAVRSVVGNQFAITSIALDSGEVTFSFTSSVGATYGIFRSTDLTQPWEELDDTYQSGGESTVFVDVDVPAGAARVFYQVRQGEG